MPKFPNTVKILYAIQGTGNGHLSRARDVIPALSAHGELDLLVSGIQADVELPFPVKYRYKGLSFVFGKKGGVDLWETFKKTKTKRLLKEVASLPIEDYDLIINDFEPVSAWAAQRKDKACIALSHQSAVLSPQAPRPNHSDWLGSFVLKRYAPATAHYGFHFARYSRHTFTPVIRQEIRQASIKNKNHVTVYLPSYGDDYLAEMLGKIEGVKWRVFSKHTKKRFREGNVVMKPINNGEFIRSMAEGSGVLCGAGFESPAEALYLGKKLMVIPMKSQYEQHCNAAALAQMGVPVLKSLKNKHLPLIENWLMHGKAPVVDYPDETQQIVDRIVTSHAPKGKAFQGISLVSAEGA